MTVVFIFVICLKWLFILNAYLDLDFNFDDEENKYTIRQVVFL